MLTIVKKNDSYDAITYQLENEDNSTVDLTGASVNFVMGKKNKLITNAKATVTSATSGIVSYQLTPSDTLVSGTFLAEFVVTFANGTTKTYPSNGYITVDVEQNLDTSQNNVVLDMIATKQGDFEAKLDSILKQGTGTQVSAMNEYTWTATSGQTIFVFPTSAKYDPSAKWFQVSVGNVPIANELINRASSSQFSLVVDPSLIVAGMTVHAMWVEPIVPITGGHHSTHEINGQDEINIANLRNYQELVATPIASNTTALAEIATVGIFLEKDFPKLAGETDDTLRIQRALNSVTKPTVIRFKAGETYTISSTLTINPNYHILEGNGAKFTFSNAGVAILVKGAGQGYNNILSCIKGIELIGAGKTVVGSIAIQFGDTGTDYAPFITFENCSIHEFETGVTWKSNTWCEKFVRCNIYSCYRAVDYPTGFINTGEEVVFEQCAIFNNNYGIRCQNAAEIIFSNGSLDYMTQRFVECLNGGKVMINNAHIEGNNDSNYWLYVQDSMSFIRVTGGVLANLGTKTAYQYGKSLSSDGGIHLDSVSYVVASGGSYAFPTLISGYGTSRNLLPYTNLGGVLIQSIDKLNYLAYGGFENNALTEWTVNTGSATPIIDNTAGVPHSGTFTLKLGAAVGTFISLYKDIALVPGQKPRMSYYAKANFNASVDQWQVLARYYDDTGASITDSQYMQTFTTGGTNPTNWTLYFSNPTTPAPPGAAKVRFFFLQANGSTSDGKGSMWFDDIIITVE